MSDWFTALTGFRERPWPDTQALLEVDGQTLRSRVNGRAFGIGTLETPSLADLRRLQVTEVDDVRQQVSQVFCSALPVSYSALPPSAPWEAFATLVLEGAYEATLWAAVLNAARTGSRVVWLTQVGGGAFGNEPEWIYAAIRRAVHAVRGLDLDVRIVSRQASSIALRELVADLGG